MRILLLLCLLLPLSAYPGQGRDGGWPESIQFLRLAKANLLELLAQSSDQDVKDAINGMHDRDESIKVEGVNLALLIKLVKSLENPDVEQIEKSKYEFNPWTTVPTKESKIASEALAKYRGET